ncbi:Autophagy protein 5 [Linum perenne]
MEAQKYVWMGAIPLQIHLHESEVTTVPPPPPALILAHRIGYLPLLLPLIKPHFSSTLPPGVDTVWFDFKGLPLKWYIPTGVLFDLLCAEPERPWNLTIHFRGYPSHLLIPCDGEDSVKWNFINSLKEADYIINGSCKNVMHMSQSDQTNLWNSVVNGTCQLQLSLVIDAANMEAFIRSTSKLKIGTIEDEFASKLSLSSQKSLKMTGEVDPAVQTKPGKVPVRLYIWTVSDDFEDLEDAPPIDSWDSISYVNRPLEIHREEGNCLTLHDAIKTLLPEFFGKKSSLNEEKRTEAEESEQNIVSQEDVDSNQMTEQGEGNVSKPLETMTSASAGNAEIKLIRIQGIEPKFEIPFSWVANHLRHPEQFLHVCVYIRIPSTNPA